jgi:hypothetical protein
LEKDDGKPLTVNQQRILLQNSGASESELRAFEERVHPPGVPKDCDREPPVLPTVWGGNGRGDGIRRLRMPGGPNGP